MAGYGAARLNNFNRTASAGLTRLAISLLTRHHDDDVLLCKSSQNCVPLRK